MHPRNTGELEGATEKIDRDNPLCGDSITLFLKIDGQGVIRDITFTGSGCTISRAAASLFTEHVKGRKFTDVKAMTKEEMLGLLQAPIAPAREKCATLPLDAVRKS